MFDVIIWSVDGLQRSSMEHEMALWIVLQIAVEAWYEYPTFLSYSLCILFKYLSWKGKKLHGHLIRVQINGLSFCISANCIGLCIITILYVPRFTQYDAKYKRQEKHWCRGWVREGKSYIKLYAYHVSNVIECNH